MKLEAGRKFEDDGRTITHFLHWFNPRFLELDARWVDALIETEGDIRNKYGEFNLKYLLISVKLDNFDFGCKRF